MNIYCSTAASQLLQVLQQKVVSRQYHVRWRPSWLEEAKPCPPPRVRLVTMTSEEYDKLTPLPVIPNTRHTKAVDLTPSAVEQRVQVQSRQPPKCGYASKLQPGFLKNGLPVKVNDRNVRICQVRNGSSSKVRNGNKQSSKHWKQSVRRSAGSFWI